MWSSRPTPSWATRSGDLTTTLQTSPVGWEISRERGAQQRTTNGGERMGAGTGLRSNTPCISVGTRGARRPRGRARLAFQPELVSARDRRRSLPAERQMGERAGVTKVEVPARHAVDMSTPSTTANLITQAQSPKGVAESLRSGKSFLDRGHSVVSALLQGRTGSTA